MANQTKIEKEIDEKDDETKKQTLKENYEKNAEKISNPTNEWKQDEQDQVQRAEDKGTKGKDDIKLNIENTMQKSERR